jgi:hypothetical protein
LTISDIMFLSVSKRIVVVGAVPCACSGGLGVVMVLNEAPGERGQQAWYSRLAQERRALSVSVEEALVNAPQEESFWQYDQDQRTTVVGTGMSNHVFPPRLSLQSRTLPGISARLGTGLVGTQSDTARHTNRWTRFVKRVRSSLSAFGFHSSVADNPALSPDESVSMQSAQAEDVLSSSGGTIDSSDSQVLSAHEVSSESASRVVTGPHVRYGAPRSTPGRHRLAGRTTRIRLEVVPAPSSAATPDKEKKYQEPQTISRSPWEVPPSHASVLANTRTPAVSALYAHNDTTGASMTFPGIDTFDNQSGASVYLPAVEKGSRRPVENSPSVNSERGTTSIRLAAIEKGSRRPVENPPSADGERGTTSIRLAAIEKGSRRSVENPPSADGERGTTSIRLAAIDTKLRSKMQCGPDADARSAATARRVEIAHGNATWYEKVAGRRKEPSPAWRAGTGKFECGQRDVTLSDPSVTSSSVVLVTLTANPGPVVVQYVSLQPGRGFTIHLTAPTAIGAPFNYIVLS